MAISILGSPDEFAPAFNPIYFYLDSTNKNQNAFKYVADIYESGTANLLASYKLAPRPNDGYGVCDINQILRSQLSEFITPLTTPETAFPSFVNYDIEFGEEYIVAWPYQDTNFAPSGQTYFVGSGGTQPFVAGDLILVTGAPSGSTYFDGVFVVLSANSNTILVDIPFLSTSGITNGTISYSDKRKTIFQDLTGFTGYTAFNGAIPHQQLNDYTSFDYNMIVNSGATFLNNAPQNYRVKPENTMRLNAYSEEFNTASLGYVVETYYGFYVLPSIALDGPVIVWNAGPADITENEVSYINDIGSFPIFKNYCYEITSITNDGGYTLLCGVGDSPWNFSNVIVLDEGIMFTNQDNQIFEAFVLDLPSTNCILISTPYSQLSGSTSGFLTQKTEWYTVQIYDGNQKVSKKQRFDIDWNTTRYGNIELLFLDRLGSYVPANFELQNVRTQNIKKESYKKLLGNLNTDVNKWAFASTDRGTNQINTQISYSLDLTSNWLTEDEANYLKELYSSPLVYIKENGQLWPVVITTNSYVVQTKNNKKNIQIKITIEYANNDVINNIQ